MTLIPASIAHNSHPNSDGSTFGADSIGSPNTGIFTAVAQWHEIRTAIVAITVSCIALIVSAPFARLALLTVPAFIPAYEAALVIIDSVTAVLLLGQFAQQRSAALLTLAAGYLFDALMIVPHALSFPGLLTPSGWLGAGAQTTAWLYMFWHGGFAIFVAVYAVLRHRGDHKVTSPSAVLSMMALVFAAAVALTLISTEAHGLLPEIMVGNGYTAILKFVVGTVWLLTAIAVVCLVANRPYSVLDLWLIVVMVAWFADIGLSAVLNGGRFDLGFYGGRLYGLAAASVVLAVILSETSGLYGRLAAVADELERQARELDGRVRERTAELVQTNNRLSALLRASPVGVFMLDPEGRVVLWTKQAERIFGYTREQALGHLPPYLTDEHMADFRLNFARALSGEARWGFYETQRRRADGAVIDVSVRYARVEDETGQLLGVMHATSDITERKRLEAQLRQAQKMEALGALTGGMAHDFNNHLGVIILNLDILGERLSGDPEAEELAGEAAAAAERGAELVRRLLAFARRQPLQPRRSDINRVVGELAKLLQRTLGAAIEITLDLDPFLWPTVVDPAQLESGLANLANNARDAMPNGGKLRIVTGNRELDADYASQHAELVPGQYAMVELSDNGSGIPPELLSKVFDPFFTTKAPGKGTGLGLSMVYGFVKQSGGHINVYSEIGVGTTIRLYLPRDEAPDHEEAKRAASVIERGGGEAVLAVEDNPSLRRIVIRQLSEIGYRVIDAQTAQEALTVLETEPVDVLFTDVVLPGGINGYELADMVASRWPRTRLVLTSGFPETSLIGKDRLPNVTLLTKPYRREDIARVVKEALQQQAAKP